MTYQLVYVLYIVVRAFETWILRPGFESHLGLELSMWMEVIFSSVSAGGHG
jgi:hypothetical protein